MITINGKAPETSVLFNLEPVTTTFSSCTTSSSADSDDEVEAVSSATTTSSWTSTCTGAVVSVSSVPGLSA